MKQLRSIFSVGIFSLLFISCDHKNVSDNKVSPVNKEDSVKANYSNIDYSHDTALDYTDEHGLKQGYWEITGAMGKDSAYAPDAIVEKGHYVNDVKDGCWVMYYPGNKIKEDVFYTNGKIDTTKVWPTLNYVDVKGRRQGYWRITIGMKHGYISSIDTTVLEKGSYLNDKKVGEWIEYDESGKIKSKINYNAK